MDRAVEVAHIKIGQGNPLVLIAGPCVVESAEVVFRVAETMVRITQELEIPYVFKASCKKANRTSGDSFSAIGEEVALELLARVRSEYGVS